MRLPDVLLITGSLVRTHSGHVSSLITPHCALRLVLRYDQVYSKYEGFLFSGSTLVSKLLSQGSFRLHQGNSIVVMQLKDLFTDTCVVSSYFCES